MTRNVKFLALLLLISWLPAGAQAPSAATPAVEARVDALLKQLSLEEKVDLIGGVHDFYIREIKHIGLPALKMADGPFGVRNYGPSTTFGGIGLAATWDPELVGRIGAVIGQDARARGVHFMLGPGVNISRRSVPRLPHRSWLHHRYAESGRERDYQTLHGQQPGIPAP